MGKGKVTMYNRFKSTAYKSKLMIVLAVLLLSAQLHALGDNTDVLITGKSNELKPPWTNAEVVKRREVVNVNRDVLSKIEESTYFYLNFFSKRYMAIGRAVYNRSIDGEDDEKNATWEGKIGGIEDSQVALSRKGNLLSGSVVMGERRYLIRHFGEDDHFVLEINPDAMPKESTNAVGSDMMMLRSLRAVLQATPIEKEVFKLVNLERATRGLHSLTLDGMLTASARGHSQSMADNNFFSHTGVDGSSAGQRMRAEGYNWSTWGENIAWGQKNAQSVMNAWMNSSGHRANILGSKFCDIGVGHFSNGRPYWTQNFGRKQGVNVCKGPAPDPDPVPDPDPDPVPEPDPAPEPDPIPGGVLENGERKRFSLAQNQIVEFTIDIPKNTRKLWVKLKGKGDADLYVKRAKIEWPADQGRHRRREFKAPYRHRGSKERVVIRNPAAGRWHVLVHGYTAARVSLQAK